jgi:cytochrome c-type biogenesis protein CcmH/NrfG
MEIKLIYTCFLVLLLSLCSLTLKAQEKNTPEELADGFSAYLDSSKTKTQLNRTNFESLNKEGNTAYDSIQFDRKLKEYDFTVMHQQRCFTWQFYSSILIFIMVIFIVVMGLVLSYKQFQLSEVQVKANIAKPKSEVTAVETESTNIEISQTGLKINTGVIGLAILFLSLAFFFLYLKYVYQIDIIDMSK